MGEGIDVHTRDGRALHAVVLQGPPEVPTVVFEAGSGGDRSSWGLVQPGVAAFATAVAYDRSGLGRSPRDPESRTLDRMADDLNDLLDGLPGRGGFILVGHSAGGPIVRLAASRRPERVTGLVLVDPTDEAADVLFGRAFRVAERVSIGALWTLARIGLLRRIFASTFGDLPADVRADMARESFGPTVVQTQARQARTFLPELRAWRAAPPDLGDIAVTVVSGTRTGDGMPRTVRAAANASHLHRASVSPNGRHVLAERSGHYVPMTDPELIIDEIRRLASGPGIGRR